MASKTKQKNLGFSIVELIVTIAIVGILATLANATYSNYVIRTKIATEVFVLTTRAKEIWDLKRSDKDFYLNGENSEVNEYAALTKNIGTAGGTGIVNGYAEIMVRPELVGEDSVRWRCVVAGDILTESNIPNHCILGDATFFRILKENNMIFSEDNFQYDQTPVNNDSWGKVDTDSDFLGKWYITGGDEQIEIWNNFDNIDDIRPNVAELDGDRNEIVDFSHDLASKGFDSMQMSFDYYSRTGDNSSNFEIYLGDELVYTHDSFAKGWQTINIDLQNTSASGKTLTLRESGRDDSYGALIDLESLRVTPNKIT
ncbi:prepilin-type N-terminal cleavage/methylation domain-containing protein [Francisella philomiragia]|uniref:Prepilin-type N-terminal cleavage/methylation domain-containing protein n=1 Tax=Francisella philomiragia TaxID=28110 RepID=A0ABS1GEC9_9GAMM|nr:prepilin-type N-terminal cleavage/methylation domain-containing protein [Francisella philomiragia]MBK2025015.1 prepilin-type N-terminal cleavage/methylation domain-containing protein [Francisella philomiragia]MBK2092453.1 prepilin-type N-terminal cleavage/methylation domain-containing protein [Francisella philomiragia]MBK2257241.1 prepilin-type N-terminal cleavage/methylation domain-containing protein [Francisella philomiragia]MBK2259336.1 prepilin-type N-terminal cleavage/methylation domain